MNPDTKLAKRIYENDDNCIGCRILKWFVKREIKNECNNSVRILK